MMMMEIRRRRIREGEYKYTDGKNVERENDERREENSVQKVGSREERR